MKLSLTLLAAATAAVHWKKVYEVKNGVSTFDIGSGAFQKAVESAPHHFVKRVCDGCPGSHKNIIYKRTGDDKVNYYDLFHHVWASANNKLNQQFELFSNDNDAVNGANKWRFCNYDDVDHKIGFPRDCGPYGAQGGIWNSKQTDSRTTKNYAYYVEVRTEDTSVAPEGYEWVKIYAKGNYGNVNVGEKTFNELADKTGVVKRMCGDCSTDHDEVIYKRLGTSKPNGGYYSNFIKTWSDSNNRINQHFKLFSTEEDYEEDLNAWRYCNYNDFNSKIGFPRDCAPYRARGWQWNSEKHGGTRKHFAYYALKLMDEEPIKIELIVRNFNDAKKQKIINGVAQQLGVSSANIEIEVGGRASRRRLAEGFMVTVTVKVRASEAAKIAATLETVAFASATGAQFVSVHVAADAPAAFTNKWNKAINTKARQEAFSDLGMKADRYYDAKESRACCVKKCGNNKGCQKGCVHWIGHTSLNWVKKEHTLLHAQCRKHCKKAAKGLITFTHTPVARSESDACISGCDNYNKCW